VRWHLAALRVAPTNLAITAGMAGLDVHLPRGRFALDPFIEAGFGHVEGRHDLGGYYIAGSGGSVYVPLWQRVVGDGIGVGGGATQTRQPIPRQPGSCLTPAAGAFVDRAAQLEGKERLGLADHRATGAMGIEHLIEKTEEGAADVVDPITAVAAFVGLSQEARRQERAQELIEVKEALLAQAVYAPAQRSQSCPPSREKRCVHDKYLYFSMLDRQPKMTP